MTNGQADTPKVGHVLRYVYLFTHEASAGRDEGIKERFVIVAGVTGARYRVVAVTTKGEGRAGIIALPPPVAAAAGLAPDSAVVVSEYNAFTWPGFDIRPLLDRPGYIVGRLPPGFTNKIIDELLTRKATHVERG